GRGLGRWRKGGGLACERDAAGATATRRGMELAVGQGFAVNVVAPPSGVDPADDPSGFEARLAAAKPYALYRTQVEAERGGYQAVNAFLRPLADSPEKSEAIRWASDRLGVGLQLPSVRPSADRAPPPRPPAPPT